MEWFTKNEIAWGSRQARREKYREIQIKPVTILSGIERVRNMAIALYYYATDCGVTKDTLKKWMESKHINTTYVNQMTHGMRVVFINTCIENLPNEVSKL